MGKEGWDGKEFELGNIPTYSLLKTGEKSTFMVFIPFSPECFLLSFFLSVVLADFGNEALLGAPGSQGVFI